MVKDAFELAQNVRYKGDIESLDIPTNDSFLKQAQLEFSLTSLKASSDLTPKIYKAFKKVANRLNLDSDLVEIYILSSSDVQASCLSFNTEGCIITLNSSLVNLLKINELEFIIGHELGHFLLQHNRKYIDGSPESLISNRAMEISVDRIGLCACKDLHVAIKAIIKLLSGLEEKFLRFDVHSFLEQLIIEIKHDKTIFFDSKIRGKKRYNSPEKIRIKFLQTVYNGLRPDGMLYLSYAKKLRINIPR